MNKKRIGRTVAELFYPSCCPICDRILPLSSGRICAECEKSLPWVGENACMSCGKPLKDPRAEFCADCRKVSHLFDEGRSAFSYTAKMRGSVYRMKALNRRDYLDFYAESMVKAGGPSLARWRPQLIVPIPMSRKKRARRGYNQAELLAARISNLTGIPCEKRLLCCVKETGEQKTLSASARRKNLQGAFALSDAQDSPPSRVLVVDDVYTTGSTMDEAARVLKGAGTARVFFLVLCIGRGK